MQGVMNLPREHQQDLFSSRVDLSLNFLVFGGIENTCREETPQIKEKTY